MLRHVNDRVLPVFISVVVLHVLFREWQAQLQQLPAAWSAGSLQLQTRLSTESCMAVTKLAQVAAAAKLVMCARQHAGRVLQQLHDAAE